MATNKENATIRVRVFPSTHKKLRIRGANTGQTIAELVKVLVDTKK